MGDVFEESLFNKQPRQFNEIDVRARAFAANYCGNTIIRDSIFQVVTNYARKRELSVEILRYPCKDEELWAFTFVKKGTLFLRSEEHTSELQSRIELVCRLLRENKDRLKCPSPGDLAGAA